MNVKCRAFTEWIADSLIIDVANLVAKDRLCGSNNANDGGIESKFFFGCVNEE